MAGGTVALMTDVDAFIAGMAGTTVVATMAGALDQVGPVRMPPAQQPIGGPGLDPWNNIDLPGYVTNWKQSPIDGSRVGNIMLCVNAGWLFATPDDAPDLPTCDGADAIRRGLMVLMKMPDDVAQPLWDAQNDRDREWWISRRQQYDAQRADARAQLKR